MVTRPTEASTHSVLAIDTDKRVVEDMPAVPTAEVPVRITEMLTKHGATPVSYTHLTLPTSDLV